MSIIALIIVALNLVLVMMNYKKAIWVHLFIIMAIPLGSLTSTINTVALLRIGAFSAFEINTIVLLGMCIIGKLRINKLFIIPFCLLIIYGFNIVFSISEYGYNSVFADAKDYILSMVMILVASQVVGEKSLNEFLELALKALMCATIIIFISYAISRGTVLPTSSRYGFAIQALYVFSIPYIVYSYVTGTIRKKWMLLELFLQLYLMIISQNRTNIMIIGFTFTVMFWYYIFYMEYIDKKVRGRLKILFLVYVVIIIGLFACVSLNQDVTTGWLGRINEMLLNDFKTNSTELRSTTISYYISEIKKDIWGYGLGKYMPALSIYNSGFDPTTSLNYGFDNVFITMSYKVGVIAAIAYTMFYAMQIIGTFRNRKKFSDNMLFVIILIGLYVSCGIMTQQLLKNIGIYTFIMTLIVQLYIRNRMSFKTVKKNNEQISNLKLYI